MCVCLMLQARGLVDDTHNKSMNFGTGGTGRNAVYGSENGVRRNSSGKNDRK